MTIKRGHSNGSQRWYCKSCKRSFIGHKRLTNDIVNSRYSKGKLTINDLSEEYGVSMPYRQRILRWGLRIMAQSFLKERTTTEDGKSHYTHKTLRSAFLSLKRNMPWLWTWYDYPELKIPNTNNGLESLNANLKIKLVESTSKCKITKRAWKIRIWV